MKILRKAVVMDTVQLRRTIMRIAHEIVERNRGVEGLILVGIRKRGVPIAERIASAIEKFEGVEVPVGALDITLYRDDLQMISTSPVVGKTGIKDDINDKTVVLVDDVLFTGRTVRAALDELIDFGRPRSILLAVLIDRGHRELPIRADFIGKNVPTSSFETVEVLLNDIDGEEQVLLSDIVDEDETVDEERRDGDKSEIENILGGGVGGGVKKAKRKSRAKAAGRKAGGGTAPKRGTAKGKSKKDPRAGKRAKKKAKGTRGNQ